MPMFSLQQLWINGLLVIPAAAAAWILCRGLHLRAATRHAVWLLVLSLLVLPSVMLHIVPAEVREDATRLVRRFAGNNSGSDRGKSAEQPMHPPRVNSATDSATNELDGATSSDMAPIYSWAPHPRPHESSGEAARPALSSPDRSPRERLGSDRAGMGVSSGAAGNQSSPNRRDDEQSSSAPADPWFDLQEQESSSTVDGSNESAPSASSKHEATAQGSGKTEVEPARAAVIAYFAEFIAGAAGIRDAFVRLPALPGTVWLAGAIVIAAALAARLLHVRSLVRKAGAAPRGVIDVVERAARRIQIPSPPETRMTDADVPPMIWCARRPILVLPRKLWAQLDDASRLAVIFHELAHLRRRDHVLCWLEMVCAIFFWWNPAVWWACRQVRDEADACCDAWVVRLQPTGRRAYAQALLASTHMNGTVAFAGPVVGLGSLSPRTRRLARRLTMVMTEPLRPGLSLRGMACVAALAAAACLVAPIAACPPEEESQKQKEAELATAAAAVIEAQAADVAGMADAASTYEAFVRDRDSQGAAEAYRDALTMYTGAASQDPNAAGGDVNARLDRLEARLDRIASLLEHIGMADAIAPQHAEDPFQPTINTTHAEATFGGDDVITRTYGLPESKLRALTELMVLQEVPIFVTPRIEEGLIDVHATPGQHEIISAFLGIIHPEGVKVFDEGGASQTRQKEGEADHFKTGNDQLKQKKEELSAELQAAKERANGHESFAKDLESEIEKIESDLEALEEKADNASGEDKKAINEHAKALKQQMKEFEQALREQEREKEKAEKSADDLEASLDAIDEELETLEELAEADEAARTR